MGGENNGGSEVVQYNSRGLEKVKGGVGMVLFDLRKDNVMPSAFFSHGETM